MDDRIFINTDEDGSGRMRSPGPGETLEQFSMDGRDYVTPAGGVITGPLDLDPDPDDPDWSPARGREPRAMSPAELERMREYMDPGGRLGLELSRGIVDDTLCECWLEGRLAAHVQQLPEDPGPFEAYVVRADPVG